LNWRVIIASTRQAALATRAASPDQIDRRRRKSPQLSGISKRVSRYRTQEVCPWNGPKFVALNGRERERERKRERERERKREREREQRPTEPAFAARAAGEPPFGVRLEPGASGSHPGTASPSLVDLMFMDESGWAAFSRGSPLRRAGRAGFRRNVAVALGNWGDEAAVQVLKAGLSDYDPLVRSHSAWALGAIGSAEAVSALEALEPHERDPLVRNELEAALARPRPKVT
jgi:hypothetical protein